MWMGFLQDRKLVDNLLENGSLISYSFISKFSHEFLKLVDDQQKISFCF